MQINTRLRVRRLFALASLTLTFAGEAPALAQSSLPPPPPPPPPMAGPLIAPQFPTSAPQAEKAEAAKAAAPARAAAPANGRSQ
jgi:hypothetical protein